MKNSHLAGFCTVLVACGHYVVMEHGAVHAESRTGRERDGALWRRSLAGEAEAFALLFDRHRDRVFKHASRFTANRAADAEDLAAMAFLELWRRRDRVRLVEDSVLPWLLATTTNLGLNAKRSRRRHARVLERLPRAADQPDAADIALEIHGLGIDSGLRTGLRALKPLDAQLLALVALEDYTVTAAAQCLGLSESAARARLLRARTMVQEIATDVRPRRHGFVGQEEG